MSYLVDGDGVLAIKRVCVIGAGTMGSGIAAHLANLGFEVTLLDTSQESVIVNFDRSKMARPPHYYFPDRANDIRLGNTTEHLAWVSEADWVCEAVFEDLGVKKALFAKIDPYLRPDAMITTNTSGLQIALLAEDMSDGFKERFHGTHFFNPPRFLKLLELIPTNDTDPEVVHLMGKFLEAKVARRVVVAKDTPGFIANRYGMWCMFQAVHVAERLHLSVEEVDTITGPFLGRPRSGSFRLNDLVGLDVMRDIARNLIERCPNDPHVNAFQLPNAIIQLLARGWIGEKSGQGFYRREGKEFLAVDLQTLAYRQGREVDLPTVNSLLTLPLGERLRQALDLRDETGEFLRNYLIPILRYADYLKEEISNSVLDFDRVMMWGFGWQMGPFAMIDAIGPERLGLADKRFYQVGSQLGFDAVYHPIAERPEYAPLTSYPILSSGETFLLRDLGDGICAVSLTTKMGVINPVVVRELTELFEKQSMNRCVLTSEAKSFSAGYDLKFFSERILANDFVGIEEELASLQRLGELLESRGTVAAVFGHCLGAGLELALSCAHIVAQAETQIGLPEPKVGLIPGGRGTALMRLNNENSARRLAEVAVTMAEGTISSTADHARTLGYLRATDVTSYHPDRLIFDAKKVALSASPIERPLWLQMEGPLVGMIDRGHAEARSKGSMSEYDEVIANKIKTIFAKATSYEDALAKERSEFADLCNRAFTHARIKHMLETNRPLRN